MTFMVRIMVIYLCVALTLYLVDGTRLTEEDEMKRRASSKSFGSLKQTIKFKGRKQMNHIMNCSPRRDAI